MISVVVGKGDRSRTFHVYEGLLKHCSAYFRSALRPEWKEGDTKIINLTEDNVKVFESFSCWLYTKSLYYTLEANGSSPLSFELIIEVYIFADARGIPSSPTPLSIFSSRRARRSGITRHPICNNHVCDNTMEGSKLRAFFVDCAIEVLTFKPTMSLKFLAKGDVQQHVVMLL